MLESHRLSWELTRGRAATVFLVYLAQLTINLAGLLTFYVGLFVTLPMTSLVTAVTYNALCGHPEATVPPEPKTADEDAGPDWGPTDSRSGSRGSRGLRRQLLEQCDDLRRIPIGGADLARGDPPVGRDDERRRDPSVAKTAGTLAARKKVMCQDCPSTNWRTAPVESLTETQTNAIPLSLSRGSSARRAIEGISRTQGGTRSPRC